MPRNDPAFLPALPSPSTEFEVIDPAQPSAGPWRFKFALEDGHADFLALAEKLRQYEAQYVEGGDVIRAQPGEAPIPISNALCQFVTQFLMAERCPSTEKPEEFCPWSFEQWVIFSRRCPSAFKDVVRAYEALLTEAYGQPAGAHEAETVLKNV